MDTDATITMSGAVHQGRTVRGLPLITTGYVKNRALEKQQAEDVNPPSSSYGMSRVVIYGLAGLLVLAAILYLLALIVGDEISLGGHSDSTALSEIVIGNDVLNVPANMIRYRKQRVSATQSRLELYLHWPSMSGYSEALQPEFNKSGDEINLVFISIESRHMTHDMSGRIESIYAQHFDGASSDGGNGLIRQPLSPQGGYIDEDLYYESASPYPFATRCVREDSKISTPFCMRDVHIGKQLMMTYRYHKKFLPQWLAIERSVRNHIKEMLSRVGG